MPASIADRGTNGFFNSPEYDSDTLSNSSTLLTGINLHQSVLDLTTSVQICSRFAELRPK